MSVQLKEVEWSEFVLGKIFNIKATKSSIDKNKIRTGKGVTPYITRSEKSNGIDFFVCEQEQKYIKDNKNVITIGLDTQTVFYQPHEFYTGQNIQILANQNLNGLNAKFLIPLIKKQLEKFSWGGNGATLSRLRRSKIILPVNASNEPDYDFMERYIRRKEQVQLEKYRAYIGTKIKRLKDFEAVPPLDEKKWGEFFISEIATVISGRDIYEAERVHGDIPYISATALNNGIGYFVANKNETLESNCLSVNRNGSVGYSFYHPYQGLFSNDCRKLRLKHNSEFVGLFISRVITHQKEKYGYGYKMGTARIKRQKILLPINVQCEPDYVYMENYIKKLQFAKLSEYARKKEFPIFQ